MRLEGHVFRVGRYWAVEVPILDVASQGRTKKEALKMIADAVESLVNRPGFTLKVFPGTREHFEISSEDQPTLTAFLIRRTRQRAGLSLTQVAERLGATSINAYARYEQGKSVPTIQKLSELFAAVMPHRDLVLIESES